MKILQLCKKFPYPIKDGEVIAIHQLSRSLHALGAELTLLCMNTPKHYYKVADVPAHFNMYKEIHAIDVDTSVKAIPAFLNLFSKASYHIARFDSEAFRQKLIALLKEEAFDVIQLETLYLAPYIPAIRQYSKARVVMRAHNVEFEIWERITSNTSFPLKRWYLQILSRRLRQFEQEQLDKYDLLLPITKRDLDKLKNIGFKGKAMLTPIGLKATDYQPDMSSYQKSISLSFIGSLDWMPNVEGLDWFMAKVWPLAQKRFPSLQLHLAGRNTPASLFEKANDQLKVHGEIPDAQAFINEHAVMLVPLLSGSGMRVKILEGMALGKVVLTTSIGLEGINAKHKKEVLIADSPEAFLEALDFCHQHPKKLVQIGKAARQLIIEEYDNTTIAKQLLETYRQECKA